MKMGDLPPRMPHVTDDDLLSTIFESATERWAEIASTQPELARQIEQRANRFRREIEGKDVSPIELQQEIIDFTTFIIASVRHAIESRKPEVPPEVNPPAVV